MTYNCIMGVDPGAGGSFAFYFPSHPNQIGIYDTPSDGKRINVNELAKIIRQFEPDVAFIEDVHAFPKQGVVSVWNFAEAHGTFLGVVGALGIKTALISPKKWKKELELTSDKNESLEMARMLWPDSAMFKRKRDHNRAEAALIAFYGFKSQFEQ